jgi:hypothetical protein
MSLLGITLVLFAINLMLVGISSSLFRIANALEERKDKR